MITFLTVTLFAMPLLGQSETTMRPKAPFHVLFSNDTTNILTCLSPFHQRGQKFTPQMIEATVDETAGTGIEVHMLQPGLGWVPWWKSRVYPYSEHVRLMKERYGLDPAKDGITDYMAHGGDMVQVFVDRCRQKGLTPFISLRMNDSHGHELTLNPPDKMPGWAWEVVCPPVFDHPEWRIGGKLNDWNTRVFNWAVPEVRELKLNHINDICEQYDIDGFEMDYMRHCSFFRLNETPPEERVRIMTDFIKRVRELLDRTAKPGRRRWLCVRVPAYVEAYEALGIDLPRWVQAGVDMVNLSYYYFTEQRGDYAAIRKMVPGAAVYVEMCHTTRLGPVVTQKSKYDNFSFRRTTDIQYYTTAHVAYARGLDGVSAFNLVYYREHGGRERGPFNEPPFRIFKHMGDPAWLAKQPQDYIIGDVWNAPGLASRPLPKTLAAGQGATFTMDMAPPAGGWTQPGRLRIQAAADLGTSVWSCRFNGAELQETNDRSEPYDNPYPPLLGGPEDHRAWIVPPSLPKDGANTIEVRLNAGGSAKLVYVDLAIR
jgi:hypothetical protein